jgi:hypothetical protein
MHPRLYKEKSAMDEEKKQVSIVTPLESATAYVHTPRR